MGLEDSQPRQGEDEESAKSTPPAETPDWLMRGGAGAYDPFESVRDTGPTMPTIRDVPSKDSPRAAYGGSAPTPAVEASSGPEFETGMASATMGHDPMVRERRAADTPPTPTGEPPPRYEFFDEAEQAPRRKPRAQVFYDYGQPEAPPPKPSAIGSFIGGIRSNPWILLVVLVVAIGVYIAVARMTVDSDLTSVSTIRHQARAFDGRTVKVKGRIGAVFPVGSSYAYNLHQGRDTLVVFTRNRVPVSREKVVVEGSISTGFLEGQARPALFEHGQ